MKQNILKMTPNTKPKTPSLRFSPTAWAKLLFLRDAGETEIGGFGISAVDDLLYVSDVELVAQQCSWTHVAFSDESVAELFDRQVDLGRRPEQFGRIWIHTHPGTSPAPSPTDESTFLRVFGRCDWAVMFILARGGQTYCRLRFNTGPGAALEISSDFDFSRPFLGSDEAVWSDEYAKNVTDTAEERQLETVARAGHQPEGSAAMGDWHDAWNEYWEFDNLENVYGYVRDF